MAANFLMRCRGSRLVLQSTLAYPWWVRPRILPFSPRGHVRVWCGASPWRESFYQATSVSVFALPLAVASCSCSCAAKVFKLCAHLLFHFAVAGRAGNGLWVKVLQGNKRWKSAGQGWVGSSRTLAGCLGFVWGESYFTLEFMPVPISIYLFIFLRT